MKKLSIPLIILGVLLTYSSCCALSEGYKASLSGEMYYLLWKHPHIVYKWGATGVYDKNEADCSGTFYAIAKKIGWNVQRLTAKDMEAGLGNWRNISITLDKAEETTLVWWSWGLKDYKEGKGKPPKRIHGHIGMLMISPKSGLLEVVHNNLSKGLHIEPLVNVFIDDLSSVKNLTLGDKVEPVLGRGVIKITPAVKK
jgi:hypothetical protein